MSMFICPSCSLPLRQSDATYNCENGHCFDVASEGYVNLLAVNAKNSKNPGDDRDMARARAAFLSKGYYAPLRDALCSLAEKYSENGCHFIDSGCGEGYYTSAIAAALSAKGGQSAGIDISKHIIKKAAKRGGAEYAVASSYHLPVAACTVDMLLNCFSPLAIDEFRRVLKPGGYFLYVVPGSEHLWEMKCVLYESPYKNEEKLTPYNGFSYVDVHRVLYNISIPFQDDIKALFGMTPYFWKTPKEGRQRLYALGSLDLTVSFNIHVFRKNIDNRP